MLIANLSFAASVGQDFASQVYYWDAYKKACKRDRRQRGRHVNVRVAEWITGAVPAPLHVFSLFLVCVACSPCCHPFLSRALREGLPADWTMPIRGVVCCDQFYGLFPWRKDAEALTLAPACGSPGGGQLPTHGHLPFCWSGRIRPGHDAVGSPKSSTRLRFR